MRKLSHALASDYLIAPKKELVLLEFLPEEIKEVKKAARLDGQTVQEFVSTAIQDFLQNWR